MVCSGGRAAHTSASILHTLLCAISLHLSVLLGARLVSTLNTQIRCRSQRHRASRIPGTNYSPPHVMTPVIAKQLVSIAALDSKSAAATPLDTFSSGAHGSRPASSSLTPAVPSASTSHRGKGPAAAAPLWRSPDALLTLTAIALHVVWVTAVAASAWGRTAPFANASPWLPLLASTGYAAFVLLGPRWMRSRQPLQLTGSMFVYNVYQAAFNALIVVAAVGVVLANGFAWWGERLDLSSPRQTSMGIVMYLHYSDKYLEFFDSAVMVLRKKDEQLSFLHCWHHFVMPWVWFYVLSNGAGEGSSIRVEPHVLLRCSSSVQSSLISIFVVRVWLLFQAATPTSAPW